MQSLVSANVSEDAGLCTIAPVAPVRLRKVNESKIAAKKSTMMTFDLAVLEAKDEATVTVISSSCSPSTPWEASRGAATLRAVRAAGATTRLARKQLLTS